MKDFLLVLFYQAIVAVNTAVVLSGIVWIAKRKDEKDGRKPPTTGNFGITEDTVKELGRAMAHIGVSCDTIAEALNGLADAMRKREEQSVTPKPPTTGTSVVKPKKRKYDEYSALPYAVGTVQRFFKPILTSAIVLAEDGKIIIPPEEAGTPVSGYGDGKIYGYVQTLVPDDGNDDGKAYPINPRTGEVEGYPAIDGTVYRVYFWTSGKAAKTVRVTPFDGALNAVPVSVYNPAEESVKRYEARTAQLPHYCGNCIAHRQEKFDGEIIHVCMRHKVWLHNQERWDGGCDAWEPSPAICKLYKEWADGFCASCEYFEPEEPGQKRGMGLCARNDEIKMMGQSCAGYTRKGELPKYLERQPMETPEPLGTVTTH